MLTQEFMQIHTLYNLNMYSAISPLLLIYMWNHFFLDLDYLCTNKLASIQANNKLFEVGR